MGESISWTLRNFQNRSGQVATDFEVVDLPGLGLNFMAGSLPAFHNGAGVTYDIRYTIAGSAVWHTYATGIDASRPFSFSLPQPGDIYYTAIGFFFGDVPADFALGNTIVLTFMAGANAPNGTLVNRFFVSYGNQTRQNESGANVLPPPSGSTSWVWDAENGMWIYNPLVPLGAMPQTGASATLWVAAALNITFVGALGAMIVMKRKKKNKPR